MLCSSPVVQKGSVLTKLIFLVLETAGEVKHPFSRALVDCGDEISVLDLTVLYFCHKGF